MPTVLFIPDRFMDYRLWADIPDLLRNYVRTIHFDQHADLSWATDDGEFLDTSRRLADGGSFQVVAAAGQAARFGFALAEAGLAEGLVFFHPVFDNVPDDVDVDFSGLDEKLTLYQPVVSALNEPDPAKRRDILAQVLRATAPPGTDPAELERTIGMFGDHVDEIFAHLQSAAAMSREAHSVTAVPPLVVRPSGDRLAQLDVAVTVVVSSQGRAIGEAIARRAKRAEVVVAKGSGLLGDSAGRSQAAEVLLRMLRSIR